MKLIFTKDSQNEIGVKLQKGTILEDFTYTEMIRQLLIENSFNDTEFNNLSNDEQAKINLMLEKVAEIFKSDSTDEPTL